MACIEPGSLWEEGARGIDLQPAARRAAELRGVHQPGVGAVIRQASVGDTDARCRLALTPVGTDAQTTFNKVANSLAGS